MPGAGGGVKIAVKTCFVLFCFLFEFCGVLTEATVMASVREEFELDVVQLLFLVCVVTMS